MRFVCGGGRGVCVVCWCVVQFLYLWLDKRRQQANQKQKKKRKLNNFRRNKKQFRNYCATNDIRPRPQRMESSRLCLFERSSHFKLNWMCFAGTPQFSGSKRRLKEEQYRRQWTGRREERAYRSKPRNKNEARKTVRITVHLIKLICEEKNHSIYARHNRTSVRHSLCTGMRGYDESIKFIGMAIIVASLTVSVSVRIVSLCARATSTCEVRAAKAPMCWLRRLRRQRHQQKRLPHRPQRVYGFTCLPLS